MFIKQRRVRALEHHLDPLNKGKSLRIAARLPNQPAALLKLGFDDPAVPGHSVLPSACFGPSCRFNAEGREIPQRHLPKETRYRSQMWTHTERHGQDTVEVESLVSIPYQRYPRLFIEPPCVRLTVHASTDGELYAASDLFVFGTDDAQLLIAINVFLEIFGECEVQQDDGALLRPPRIRSLDWVVLPTGTCPWDQINQQVSRSFSGTPPHTFAAIQRRMESLYRYEPEVMVVGNAGFNGYVIFCYPARELYVLECRRPDNATYVLGSDWASLSKMSKGEILRARLHRARIVHTSDWEQKIGALFPPLARAA